LKPTSLIPWLLASVTIAALAAEPSPSPSPASAITAPLAATTAGPADAGTAATDAGAAASPAPLCSLETGVDRTAPSSGCTSCHTSTTGSFDHGGHRVDIAYEPYGKDLRPNPLERGVNVVLPGGRITCLTCHDPQSKLPDHLAAPISGPVEKRLCTACHLFD
jgi:hypothetical protein